MKGTSADRHNNPYPYCPHGKYVGGCGADYMCFFCEMGEEDATPREMATYRDNAAWRMVAWLEEFDEVFTALIRPDLYSDLVNDHDNVKAYRRWATELAFAEQWADGPDDRQWRDNHYQAQIDAWHEQTADEQFWGLPDHVLDGA